MEIGREKGRSAQYKKEIHLVSKFVYLAFKKYTDRKVAYHTAYCWNTPYQNEKKKSLLCFWWCQWVW